MALETAQKEVKKIRKDTFDYREKLCLKLQSSVNKKRKGKGFTSIDISASWPSDTTGFKHVDATENPKATKEWRKIDVPQEIEFYVLMQNKLHFGQVQRTPFIIPPLSVEVDWGANLVTSKLVLEGNYTNEELLDIEKVLIHHCRRKYDCKLVDAKITKKEWQEKECSMG
eukprot:4140340-Ditylum_brightwellii.AAC.1